MLSASLNVCFQGQSVHEGTLLTQCLLVAQLRHAPLQWDLGFTLESGSLSDHDTRPGPASQPWHSMLGLTKVTPQSERRNLGL